ncbi:MAG: bifunctional 2-polyprenyl-6-hydroxyphenol methylase/3-demethylubiquinol 3-O-methyltransferase UbiG [Magnetococcus sp. WYHC-3]
MSASPSDEVAKFERLAHEWWDLEGRFKTLHQLNPVRLNYIRRTLRRRDDGDLTGLRMADIGCGGGILAESLDRCGAEVVAMDRSLRIIEVARTHQRQSGSRVDYRVQSVSELAAESPGTFDAVTAMEVLEHVDDPAAFVADCATLLKPGGTLFVATLNRTAKSWLMAIVGAEYVLGWLPRGTHQYQRFLRPSEVRDAMAGAGVVLRDLVGVGYRPVRRDWVQTSDPAVNYMGYGVRLGAG